MRQRVNQLLNRFGVRISRYTQDIHQTACVSLRPQGRSRGNVLLAYVVQPFLTGPDRMPDTHTHFWESWQMSQTFLNLGYAVDAISYLNTSFNPSKDYAVYMAARTNFQRIARQLDPACVKIAHLDTAHWLVNNTAAYQRALALQRRRGVSLKSFKWVEPNWAIEAADCATVLGNEFTLSTYRYADRPLYRLPVPTCRVYAWPERKDFDACRRHFMWPGSSGLVHKGLDLVLEAFSGMPDLHLTVCGPIQSDKDFEQAFHRELYQTGNIHTVGWVDVGSPEFVALAERCVGLIYPSCSEGQAGSVVTCMQASLIPIVSHESGVDVEGFGGVLGDCSIETIRETIRGVADLPPSQLEAMAHKSWTFARANNSRERYAEEFCSAVTTIMTVRGADVRHCR